VLEINFINQNFIANKIQTNLSIDIITTSVPIEISSPPKINLEIQSTQQFLPSQLNQSGKYLKTNGSSAFWSIPPAGSVDSSYPESGSLVRNNNNQVMQVILESKTVDITRDESGKIQQVSDGTYNYIFTRNNSGIISSWSVSEII
jgi:hypothetical protein